IAPEEPSGHGKADKDNQAAEKRLRDLAGEAGRDVAADGACDHSQQAIAPDDLAFGHKNDKGDAVGQGSGDHFEGVYLVEVAVAEEREQGDEEKTSSGAKVADVKADHDG